MLPGRSMTGCETHLMPLGNHVCSITSVSDQRGASLQLCYVRLTQPVYYCML